MSQTVIATYYRGDKKVNELLRKLDLYKEGEGIVIEEKATLTVKDGVKLNKAWVKRCKEGLKTAWDMVGFEIHDIKLMLPEKEL